MNFSQGTRGIIRTLAIILSVALPLAITIEAADARVGVGGRSGSRGSRTYSAPPSTTTAPGAAQPMNRTFTQPGTPAAGTAAAGAANKGGFFNRPGMGMLGGLAAGFLGAGLLGMLFGGGLFSGLGGLSSIIGLLLQIGFRQGRDRPAVSRQRAPRHGVSLPRLRFRAGRGALREVGGDAPLPPRGAPR